MILCDSRIGSKEIAPLIKKFGVQVELMTLEFADFVMDGNGPHGPMPVAIERKTLGDMLQCIDDSRYAGHQRPGMAKLYKGGAIYLLLEGEWMANHTSGLLMEAHKGQWHYCRPGGRTVLYSKLYRYLLSIQMVGVTVIHGRNPTDSAYNICELFHYWQKKWDDHTAMKEMHKLPIPQMVLDGDVPLVRKWAASINSVGLKLSERAARKFKTPIALAQADELDWVTVDGVGVERAKKIVREVRAWHK